MTMRFQGLPEDLSVGARNLRPCTPCAPLKPCTDCGFVKMLFFTCEPNGHPLCDECSLRREDGRRWCSLCRSFVGMTPATVPLDLLAELVFECECGLKAPLREIREHLLKDGPHPRTAEVQLKDELQHVDESTIELQSTALHDATRWVLCSKPELRHRPGICTAWFDFDEFYALFLDRGERTKSEKIAVTISDLPLEIYLVLDTTFDLDHLTAVTMVSAGVKDDVLLPLRNELRLALIDPQSLSPLPDKHYLKIPNPVNSDIGSLLAAQSAVVSIDVLKEKLLSSRGQVGVRIELCPISSSTNPTSV